MYRKNTSLYMLILYFAPLLNFLEQIFIQLVLLDFLNYHLMSINRWMDKEAVLWYKSTVEYFSAVKRTHLR